MKTEVTDALLALLLLIVGVILMLVVSYNATPSENVLQHWERTNPQELKEYQEKQDWYFYSFNQ